MWTEVVENTNEIFYLFTQHNILSAELVQNKICYNANISLVKEIFGKKGIIEILF